MDGESVSQFPSEKEEEPPFSFKKVFHEQFSYYIHLGMSYDEYWRMDCELVRDYRKAYEYKQQYDNSQLWLQGLYIYKAIDAQRPGFIFYGKKSPKTDSYIDKPLAVTKEMKEQYAAENTRQMAARVKAALHKRNQNLDDNPEEGEKNGRHGTRKSRNKDKGK